MITLEQCVNAFGPEIFQQNIAVWIAMVLGVMVSTAGLYLSVRSAAFRVDALVLVVVGIATVLVGLTGKVPFLDGQIADVEAYTIEFEKTYKAGCYALNDAAPDTVLPDTPSLEVSAIPSTKSPSNALGSAKTDESFVWIFYAPHRFQHAEALSKLLTSEMITVDSREDEFGFVKTRLPKGDAKIVFSDTSSKALADAIASILEQPDFGSTVTLLGPDSSVSRKPIQVQLF